MSLETNARLVALALFALLLPIYLTFDHFNAEPRGFVVTCVTAVVCAAAYTQRRYRNRIRIWLLIAAIYIVELAVVLLVPLPAKMHGSTMLPISTADLLFVLWLVSLFPRGDELPPN